MSRTLAFVLLPALVLGAAPAQAHAMLDHASPPVGSILRSAPRTVALWFTQKLEPAFSTIEVRNDAGVRVDVGKAKVDGANGSVLRVGLKPLARGRYQVHWRILSVDTHTSEGTFAFAVEQ